MSHVDTPQELSLGLLLPVRAREGGPLALVAQPGALAEISGLGCQLPVACLPLLAIPAEAGRENAIWVLLRKAAVWRIHFQKVRCNCG